MIIREFSQDGDGNPLSKYEAKYVTDIRKPYIDSDIVLVKKTEPIFGHERTYQLPREVIDQVATSLPE